jgi:predicted phosphodiesterase
MTERHRLAIEILKKNPESSKRRLAMMLHAKHSVVFKNVESARSAIREATGTSGARNRKQIKSRVVNNPRSGSKVYALPKSTAKAWEPHRTKAKCIAIFSDTHFPVHDPQAIEAAVKHVKQNFNPDCILLNGDIADSLEFGNWAKSPKAIQTENSLESIQGGLLYFRHQFPKAEMIYKFGNHEDRLERYCWQKAPELVGLEHLTWQGLLTSRRKDKGGLESIKELESIIWVGEERPVITNGGLAIFHGHEFPRTQSNNPARTAFLKTNTSVLVGHHHQTSSYVGMTWDKIEMPCYSVGCLCELHPRYARNNNFNLGHAVVETTKNSFEVHNFRHTKNGIRKA